MEQLGLLVNLESTTKRMTECLVTEHDHVVRVSVHLSGIFSMIEAIVAEGWLGRCSHNALQVFYAQSRFRFGSEEFFNIIKVSL